MGKLDDIDKFFELYNRDCSVLEKLDRLQKEQKCLIEVSSLLETYNYYNSLFNKKIIDGLLKQSQIEIINMVNLHNMLIKEYRVLEQSIESYLSHLKEMLQDILKIKINVEYDNYCIDFYAENNNALFSKLRLYLNDKTYYLECNGKKDKVLKKIKKIITDLKFKEKEM